MGHHYSCGKKAKAQHAHLCKPGRRSNNDLRCIFHQKFQPAPGELLGAEKTLLSDSNINELLF